MFELVNKADYQSTREYFESVILLETQKFMKQEYERSFNFRLMGRKQHHLVTRVIGGDGSFNLEYFIIVPAPKEGFRYKAELLKKRFMNGVAQAIRNTKYPTPEDATTTISFKIADVKKPELAHNVELAIIYFDKNEIDNGYFYINKKQKDGADVYSFDKRPLSINAETMHVAIHDHNVWTPVREEYIKLKNAPENEGKHSFEIFWQTINNIYNTKCLGDAPQK